MMLAERLREVTGLDPIIINADAGANGLTMPGKFLNPFIVRVSQIDSVYVNVNVPDVPWASIDGFEVTRLGNRHRAEPVIKSKDPRGRPIWWIGSAGAEADAGLPGLAEPAHLLLAGAAVVAPATSGRRVAQNCPTYRDRHARRIRRRCVLPQLARPRHGDDRDGRLDRR